MSFGSIASPLFEAIPRINDADTNPFSILVINLTNSMQIIDE